MSLNSSSNPPNAPVINVSAFIRTLIAPLMVWTVVVIIITLAGQPGVVCVTPMAWLLALWCGGRYIRLTDGRPERWPLLGPAIIGALLGLGMGVIGLWWGLCAGLTAVAIALLARFLRLSSREIVPLEGHPPHPSLP